MRTDPNGSSYIGITTFPEIRRWQEHCCDAFNKNGKNYNTPLSKAIRKHGRDGFVCTILEDGIDDFNALLKREEYWIDYYGTFKNGLNATKGGDGYKVRDSEEIIKLWNDGHCVRDISLLLKSDAATILRHLNLTPQQAGLRGPVYKTKNSMKYFGDYKTGRGITISCFDIKTGEFVRSFRSFYEAENFVKASSSAAIIRATNGIIKTAFGYYWREGADQTPLSDDVLAYISAKSKRIRKPVVCIEKHEMYSDTVYAEKMTGICYRSITFACQGHQQTAGGYHWRYATDEDKQNLTLLKEDKPHKMAHNVRKVKCIETGIVYDSLKLAGEAIGLSNSSIYSCCTKKSETAGGFHFEYFNEGDAV